MKQRKMGDNVHTRVKAQNILKRRLVQVIREKVGIGLLRSASA